MVNGDDEKAIFRAPNQDQNTLIPCTCTGDQNMVYVSQDNKVFLRGDQECQRERIINQMLIFGTN